MAFARDTHGTAIEVYPADSVIKPNGQPGAEFVRTGNAPAFSPVHFALSVKCNVADIQAIARREQWQCHICNRGDHFDVVELWIEDGFLVELLPPAFAARYLAFAAPWSMTGSPAGFKLGKWSD